jgi:hypothetical protein
MRQALEAITGRTIETWNDARASYDDVIRVIRQALDYAKAEA